MGQQGWCGKTRCEIKLLHPTVPQLHQHKESASYSLFVESQLFVGHFELLFMNVGQYELFTAPQHSLQGMYRPL